MLEEIPKARAARSWFGYGKWGAPYWFIGMEPGGADDGDLSYESWDALGSPELLDCKAHHEDWNARGGRPPAHWHDPFPPIQSTWGPLIRTLLSFEHCAYDDDAVRTYQSARWGMACDETAVIELSALHAKNMGVDVDRTLHRAERIETLRERLETSQPQFALFYGTTYAAEYAKIAGAFNAEGWRWNNNTLCVLVQHPAYRYAPGRDYWIALGQWMRRAVDAGPRALIDGCPQAPARPNHTIKPSSGIEQERLDVEGDSFIIRRQGDEVGRITYDGWRVLVEERLPNGAYRPLGFYENTRQSQFSRKVREIDDIFERWRSLPIRDGSLVKANWRKAEFVPNFAPPPGALTIGCTVLESGGIPIAYIYKTRPSSAVLLPV